MIYSQSFQHIQPPPPSIIQPHLFLLALTVFRYSIAQLFERVTIVENSRLNTVLLDLRAAMVRHGEGQLPENATAYASQLDSFWPFVLENFLIKIGRPVDREAICKKQQSIRRLDSGTSQHQPFSSLKPSYPVNGNSCSRGACCQLLHVNIIPSATALPLPFYVQVVVQDVNDNSPVFSAIHTPYAVIREDASMDQPIWLPQAYDPDSPQYSVTEYRLDNWIQGNATHFQLGVAEQNYDLPNDATVSEKIFDWPISTDSMDVYTGRPYLTPTMQLDREAQDLYVFTLLAIDGGDRNSTNPDSPNRALTGSVNVVIQIKDINDNHPLFDSNLYKSKTVENVMTTNVLEFEVTDKDIGDNGRVAVSIQDSSGFAQRLFRVNLHSVPNPITPHTNTDTPSESVGSQYRGVLQLVNHIDAERYPAVLRFSMVASDYGQPSLSSMAEVHIQVVNVNDKAPAIAFFSKGKRLIDGRLSLPEVEMPSRALVVLVHVTDEDSPVTQLRCQIIDETDTFSLEEASGSIFQPYRSDLIFNTAVEPRGIVASYRQFAIRTKKLLDREAKSSYVVTVECTDSEGANSLTGNASLHVGVTDVNDHAPTFDKESYVGRVIENSPTAEVQLSSPMHVTDLDSGPNALLIFSLHELENDTTGTPDQQLAVSNQSRYFRIDGRSGRIWTVTSLDCETRNEYRLLVLARDSGTPLSLSGSATVNIIVEDVNDNVPEFGLTHYLFEVPENSPGGTEIGRVEATDRDLTEVNRKLRYGVKGRAEDIHLISIDRTTGILRTRRPIDRESRSSISFVITAENEAPVRSATWLSSAVPDGFKMGHDLSAQVVAKANVVVNILNVNDNRPEFVLIEPHRSHLTFIWEQLGVPSKPADQTNKSSKPKLNSVNFTDGSQQIRESKKVDEAIVHPVCERLPHRVTDKDCEPDSPIECCSLELLDNFDGLFILMPEAQNVLCVTRRPSTPKSYKLTLIARDGTTNDSLSSQIHFTVIIRSDPSIRMNGNVIQHGQGRSMIESTSHRHVKEPTRADNWLGGTIWPNGILSDTGHDMNRKARLSHSQAVPIGTKVPNSGQLQQTVIIIVMVSVAGILCVLLLMAIVLTKRCIIDGKIEFTKSEQTGPNETSLVVKSLSSTHSTPSKNQSCALVQIPTQRNAIHPDFYSQEMIYHHPMDSDEQTYELGGKMTSEKTGFTSPSTARSTFPYGSSGRLVFGRSSILTSPVDTHEHISSSCAMSTLMDSSTYEANNAKLSKLVSSQHSVGRKVKSPSGWSSVPSNQPILTSDTCLLESVRYFPNNDPQVRFIKKRTENNNAYQTIDSRLVETGRVCKQADQLHSQKQSRVESAETSGDEDATDDDRMSVNGQGSATDTKSKTSPSQTKREGGVHTPSDASAKRHLQRTDSQRNTYFQTSFV